MPPLPSACNVYVRPWPSAAGALACGHSLRVRERGRQERTPCLGAVPDDELVARLKRTYGAIAFRRQKLSIPPCRPQDWLPEQDALLGTLPDEEVARVLGRTKIAVRTRRCKLAIPNSAGLVRQHWTLQQDVLLGTMPDGELAQQLGRTLESVKLRRSRLKIIPWHRADPT